MKYKEPTKGKGIRKIFRDNGYKLYQLMNLEQVVCVQYVKEKQGDVKNSKSEKIQNHIKVVISYVMGLSSVKLVQVYGIEM